MKNHFLTFLMVLLICVSPSFAGRGSQQQQEESFMFGRVLGAIEDVEGGSTKEGLHKLASIGKDLEKREYSTRTCWEVHHWYGKALLDSGDAKAALQVLQLAQDEASSLTRKEQDETAKLKKQAMEKLSK